MDIVELLKGNTERLHRVRKLAKDVMDHPWRDGEACYAEARELAKEVQATGWHQVPQAWDALEGDPVVGERAKYTAVYRDQCDAAEKYCSAIHQVGCFTPVKQAAFYDGKPL